MYASTRAALSYRSIVFKSLGVTIRAMGDAQRLFRSLLKLAQHALRPRFAFLFNFPCFFRTLRNRKEMTFGIDLLFVNVIVLKASRDYNKAGT